MKKFRFLIVSEPRTGSNNVSYCLDAHPQLSVGNELLHPENGVRPEAYGLSTPASVGDASDGFHWIARADVADRNKVLADLFDRFNGFKVHTQHIPASLLDAIVREFDCRVILTRRLSIFDQAISNYIATARNRWHADEKPEKMIDARPFEISTEHFTQWIEGVLNVRQALWESFRSMPERVLLVEYESFYSGSLEARIGHVDALYRALDLVPLDGLAPDQASAVLKKLEHYLSDDRQKLADAGLVQQLVSNYAEIRNHYQQWLLRSYARLAAP